MILTEIEQDGITAKMASFFAGSPDLKFIVFDLETNGLAGTDVLSISAAKCQIGKDRKVVLLDQYSRYYFPRGEYNWQAIRVNGLTEEVLIRRRAGKDWPDFFDEDVASFTTWCEGIPCFVGHNIENFDCNFFAPGTFPRTFDTAVVTCDLVKIPPTDKMKRAGRYNYKTPKLTEAAEAFDIDTETGILHTSSFDVQVTTRLFAALNRQSLFRPAS